MGAGGDNGAIKIQNTPRPAGIGFIQVTLDRWRILNFNCAIVATRTQDAPLMHEAFDTLGRNLPEDEDAPAFFEEGLKQSDKPVYGPLVKSLMQEYFARWTVRH